MRLEVRAFAILLADDVFSGCHPERVRVPQQRGEGESKDPENDCRMKGATGSSLENALTLHRWLRLPRGPSTPRQAFSAGTTHRGAPLRMTAFCCVAISQDVKTQSMLLHA
jgi:hypothetical protein